jgi:hypothetical protein
MEPPNVWITVDVKEHNVGRLGFTPSFFGRRVIAPNRRPPHDRNVQKIALTAIVDQADNST